MSELNKALMEAQKSIAGIKKDGHNSYGKGGGFGYVSIEGMVKQGRETFHEFGLTLHPTEQNVFAAEGACFMQQTYKLTHVKSGESQDITRCMVLPREGNQHPCQMYGTAESYMLKNVIREILQVPRFDAKEEIDSYDNNYKQRSYGARTPGNPKAAAR